MRFNIKIIDRILILLKNQSFRTIGSNAISLYVIKLVSLLFPILIIPIVLKVIGTENYGKYVYSFSIIQYLKIIVNYGFQFTGTRDISRSIEDSSLSRQKISEIIVTRIILAFITSIILVGIGFYYYEDRWLYFFGIGSLFGFALQSSWYFQGVQKMHVMSLLALLSKVIVLVLIFIFIKKEDDFIYLNLFDSLSYLISGIVSIVIINLKHKFRLFDIKINQIYMQLKEGFNLFISTVLISLYRDVNTIILYQTGNPKLVAYYSIAERIIKSIQGINQPISHALFPYFSKAINAKSGIKNFNLIRNYASFIFLIVALLVMFLSGTLVKIYLGDGYERVALNLMILSPVVLIGFLNYYYGVIGLINKDQDLVFTKFVGISGAVNILLCFILSRLYFDLGASIALLSSEILLITILILFWRKKYSYKNQKEAIHE